MSRFTPGQALTQAQTSAADAVRMRNFIGAGTSSSRNYGYSLIEVVVLVSLVGIVAAFAVPGFNRLANGTRAIAVIALSANLRSAAQIAHAQFLASGAHLSATTMEGKSIHLRNGYPDIGPNGIRNAVFNSEGFTAHEGAGFITFLKADAPSAQQCAVTYRAAPGPSDAPIITDIEINGC